MTTQHTRTLTLFAVVVVLAITAAMPLGNESAGRADAASLAGVLTEADMSLVRGGATCDCEKTIVADATACRKALHGDYCDGPSGTCGSDDLYVGVGVDVRGCQPGNKGTCVTVLLHCENRFASTGVKATYPNMKCTSATGCHDADDICKECAHSQTSVPVIVDEKVCTI